MIAEPPQRVRKPKRRDGSRMEVVERETIIESWVRNRSLNKTANDLGIGTRTLTFKIKRYREQGFVPARGVPSARCATSGCLVPPNRWQASLAMPRRQCNGPSR